MPKISSKSVAREQTVTLTVTVTKEVPLSVFSSYDAEDKVFRAANANECVNIIKILAEKEGCPVYEIAQAILEDDGDPATLAWEVEVRD